MQWWSTLRRLTRETGYGAGPKEGAPWDHVDELALITQLLEDRKLPTQAREYPPQRRAVAALQVLLRDQGLDPGPVDGYWGPRTQYAVETLEGDDWKRPRATPKAPAPPQAVRWPKESEVRQFFGTVAEAKSRQVMLKSPYPMRLAWDPGVVLREFSCHELVAPHLGAILEGTLAAYGADGVRQLGLDLFGGCYNVRKKRGGSTYSMHSWGIAVDLDPERNQLKWGRDKARFAKKEYDAFWALVEGQGAVSLGRARNYDWMHFQFARL